MFKCIAFSCLFWPRVLACVSRTSLNDYSLGTSGHRRSTHENNYVGIAGVLRRASYIQSQRTGRKPIDAPSTGLFFGETSEEIDGINEITEVSMVENDKLIATDSKQYGDANDDESTYRLVQDHSLRTPAAVEAGGRSHNTSVGISSKDDSTRDSYFFADTAVHDALLSYVPAVAIGRNDTKTTAEPVMGSEDSESTSTSVSNRRRYEIKEGHVQNFDKSFNERSTNSQLLNIQDYDENGKDNNVDGIVLSSALPTAACRNNRLAPESTKGGKFSLRNIQENSLVNVCPTDFSSTLEVEALRKECASVIEDSVSHKQEVIIIPLVKPCDSWKSVSSTPTHNIGTKHSLTKQLHSDNVAVPQCVRASEQASPPEICAHTFRNVDVEATSECIQCCVAVDSQTVKSSVHLQLSTDEAKNIDSGHRGDVTRDSDPSRSTRLSSQKKLVIFQESKAGVNESCVESHDSVDDDSTWNMDNDDSEASDKTSCDFSSDVSDANDSKADVTEKIKSIGLSEQTGFDDGLTQFNRAPVSIDEKVQSWMLLDDCSVSRAAHSSKVINHNFRNAPCAFCGKVVVGGNIYDHFEKCERRTAYYRKLTGEDMKSAIKEYGASRRADETGLLELMEVLQDGEVKNVVLTDNLTRLYAGRLMESLCPKADRRPRDVDEVRRKVRLLGRLIIAAREKMPNICLDELIRPSKFDLIVRCVRSMTTQKDKPFLTLSQRFGCLLREIARAKEGLGLRDNDESTATSARQFLLLLDGEWHFKVGYLDGKKLRAWRRTKPRTIPLTEDLVKLRNYVLSELKKAMEQLRANQEPEDWAALARLTIVRLLTFNKRRIAEVTTLKVVQYLKRPKWHKDVRGELAHVLTPQEQSVAQRLVLVNNCNMSISK